MKISIKKNWSIILILLAIIGFVTKSLYNYPLAIMAIIGFYRFALSPKLIWEDEVLKTFIILFLCLWIPMLVSLFDAVNPLRSSQTVFSYIRFLFAGLFIIQELSKDNKYFNVFVNCIFFIVFFWCIDASIQFFVGFNLLGFPYTTGEITGMFYPRNTISHVCAILSPIYFLVIFKNTNKNKWFWLSVIPLFFIILISGRRAAWLMSALCAFGFLVCIYLSTKNKFKISITAFLIGIITTSVLTATVALHQPTKERFAVTLDLFSSDYEKINSATAVRLPIWETAYSIFKEHPINGIGPRGFRYVYNEYAEPYDYFVKRNPNLPPTQPHLLILEILAETGVIGLVGFLLLFYFLVKSIQYATNSFDEFVFLVPVIVAIFPFNAHMAFYGSVWSSMIWLLVAFYASVLKLSHSK